MGLFQKKPQFETGAPAYSIGMQKSVIIVGLGNIGKEYDGTRHNLGFACVDALATSQDLNNWTDKKDLKCQISTGVVGETRVILCKPTTYMNNSGEAVQALSHFYKIESKAIIVVHDELDIDFGQIRTGIGGGSAGHNGVKSVIEHIGADFGRVRIGVGPKTPDQIDSADFVLAKLSDAEQSQIKNLTQETNALLTEYIHANTLPTETRSFLF